MRFWALEKRPNPENLLIATNFKGSKKFSKFTDKKLDLHRNDLLMPSELRIAHNNNDAAVLNLYGLDKNTSESEIVAHLMKLYKEHMSTAK